MDALFAHKFDTYYSQDHGESGTNILRIPMFWRLINTLIPIDHRSDYKKTPKHFLSFESKLNSQ